MDDNLQHEMQGMIGVYGIEEVALAVVKSQERYFDEMLAGLLSAAKNALADLEGIMPELEPSGDREHPAWRTIEELRFATRIAECMC
jgi:hypothetical protein